MWLLFGKPVRRWVAMSVMLPLTAASLSLLGGFLQRRNGHPTRTSNALMWGSRTLGRKTADADATGQEVKSRR